MPSQPTLGTRSKNVITVDGLDFKDLDGDGQLSPYEDWRLSPRERAEDLVKRMTPEEKTGLMIIGSHYPGYSEFVPNPAPGKVLNDEDHWQSSNPITSQVYPDPILVTSSTDNAINMRHQRFFISRDNLPPTDLATWTNTVQEVAEASRLGIPVTFASNPRNHFALVPTFGVSESSGVFSEWPGELGFAALRDPDMVENFGREIAKEWRAGGLHKLYGYMADVASEPRWSRFNGTFGEDPELVSEYIAATVRGMQGTSAPGEPLSEVSIACTVKHYPGGGVRLDGHDPHFEWGQTNEYPTDDALFQFHMPPFQAAIDAGVASIMPYYAKPVNTSADQLPEQHWASEEVQFEEVAFAYDKVLIDDILRGDMGHRGYVNSDSGIIDAMPWGVESMSKPERFAYAVKAGTDIFSDMADPSELNNAYAEGLIDDADLNRACVRLLTEKFELGLFENPYVDVAKAEQAVGNDDVFELGQVVQRNSVTLLRGSETLLPLDLNTDQKIFVWATGRTKIDQVNEKFLAALKSTMPNATFVDAPEEADFAIVWARPEIALFEDDKPGVSLSVDPRANGVDVDKLVAIENTVPTLLVINVTNPWLLHEIEPAAEAIAVTFEIAPENLIKSLAGQDGGPQGQLPLTFPRTAASFERSGRDVPGTFLGDDYAYVDRDGNAYTYGYGQRYP